MEGAESKRAVALLSIAPCDIQPIRELQIDSLPSILKLPNELVSDVLISWLTIRDLRCLDIAFSNERALRFLVSRASIGIMATGEEFRLDQSDCFYLWVANRQIPLEVCQLYKHQVDSSCLEQSLYIDKQILNHSGHRLIELGLSECRYVLTLIAVNTNLLNLHLWHSVLPESLVNLLPQIKGLRSLWVMNCSSSTASNVVNNVVHSPTVTSVRVRGKYPFCLLGNASADKDAVAYLRLAALDLCEPDSDIGPTALCKPDNLTKLELVRVDFSAENMTSLLAQLVQLKVMKITDCANMTIGRWRNLFHLCRSVEVLSVITNRGEIGPVGFVSEIGTRCAESLLDLRLIGCMTEADLASLPELTEKCKKLQRLRLATGSRTPFLLRALQHCHAVRDLELQCGVFDNALLQCIGDNCPLLQSLCGDIATIPDSEDPHRDVPEDGMAALVHGCRQLKTIQLISDYDEEELKLEQAGNLWGAKYPQLTFTR